jgi:2-amino-4-hydroxy-6-hydroxymethyldihydropteridine diphosphokinase
MKNGLNKAVLMLGGNVGDTRQYFSQAIQLTEQLIGKIIKSSSLYSSQPWGFSEQPGFLNQALLVETKLTFQLIFEFTKEIEKKLGKEFLVPNGPRTIDIDFILFNNLIINTPHLTLPHPRFHFRRFNLTPLDEIIADFNHPVLNEKISTLLSNCEDSLTVFKLEE